MEAYEGNIKRLEAIAKEKGLMLNPDAERVMKVAGLMTENFQAVGEYICPCKQKNKPPIKGQDTLCPCPEMEGEIRAEGHCHCKLFYKVKFRTTAYSGNHWRGGLPLQKHMKTELPGC